MKKIIHMSDLHVGFEDNVHRFRKIVDRLIVEKGNEASRYIIVITGDIAPVNRRPIWVQPVIVLSYS